MKVVINKCYGGFHLSQDAKVLLASMAPELVIDGRLSVDSIPRHHPALVKTVETLGGTAGGEYALLKVIEIPDGIEYEVDEYDGWEIVYEVGHVWR